MFLVLPILDATDEQAQDRRDRLRAKESANLLGRLERLSCMSGLDKSKFDLDERLPADILSRVNGHQSAVPETMRGGG